MIVSQRPRRLHLTGGLLLVLVPGLLWHAGPLMPGTDGSAPSQPTVIVRKLALIGPGEAHAADLTPPPLVRKKLPELAPPAPPAVEPPPASALPAVEEGSRVKEPIAGEAEPVAPPPPPAAVGTVPASPPAPAAPSPVVAVSLPEAAPAPAPPPPPEVKPEAPKPEPKAIAGPRAAHPFSILLSSCRQKENALAALSGYRQTGLTPYIVQTDLGGKGQWWRTLLGHYRTPAEAAQARAALKLADAVVVKTPYANLIGQYESQTAVDDAARRAAQQDVSVYVVKGPANSFQLMTGAFPSQQAAEAYRRELEGKGLSTRIVQR